MMRIQFYFIHRIAVMYNVLTSISAVTKIVASDVNYGYDGKIYIADFGGGWSVNNRGSIQFIEYPLQGEFSIYKTQIYMYFR